MEKENRKDIEEIYQAYRESLKLRCDENDACFNDGKDNDYDDDDADCFCD